MKQRVAVVAIGGNSLIKDRKHQTVPDQFAATRETTRHIAEMVRAGWEIAITHGNGPQVGFILRRAELASHVLHRVPLDSCGADTQGAIGYMIQQCLHNDFRRMGIHKHVVTAVTQVVVDVNDPAFANPTKPIGSFLDREEALRRKEKEGWHVVEDAGRGWRRVVPSPRPVEIVERDGIRALLQAGLVVVAVGGGGIPVVRDETGALRGVEAVIDKDYASALLARRLHADLLLISTAVDRVALNFGRPGQRWVDRMTVAEAKQYLAAGHFPPGSMGPKIEAVIEYLEDGGKRAIVTDPVSITLALEGKAGTHIVP
jgi:carbamate kinase